MARFVLSVPNGQHYLRWHYSLQGTAINGLGTFLCLPMVDRKYSMGAVSFIELGQLMVEYGHSLSTEMNTNMSSEKQWMTEWKREVSFYRDPTESQGGQSLKETDTIEVA